METAAPPHASDGETYARAVALLRQESRLSTGQRKELRRLIAGLSASELLALEADARCAAALRRLDLMRGGDGLARVAVAAFILLVMLMLWFLFSSTAKAAPHRWGVSPPATAERIG